LSTPTETEYTGEENSTGTTTTAPQPDQERENHEEHFLGDEHTHTADCVGGCIHKEP
jgi:hypothetical protein